MNSNRLVADFVPEAVVPMQASNNLTSQANEILVIFKAPDYFEPPTTNRRAFQLCYRISDQVILNK